ncbi:MAG: hypothetical protein HKN33_07185 [Pyrinomonadaceae bacterium]|nr:hypothetical protein [Pyrinomonadaceae bacterium]
MPIEVKSENKVVRAIADGSAPRPAQVAASKGMLPLPQGDLLEALVILAIGEDPELSANAKVALGEQDAKILKEHVSSKEAPPQVLDYFARQDTLSQELYEAVIANPNTPKKAIAAFARNTTNGELLEVLSFNQQLLIAAPDILDAIIANSNRTAEADRRSQEIKREFFEKERGAEQIARELRAQGKEAAAEFIEEAEFGEDLAGEEGISEEDAILFAEHIEVPDAEIDDSWLSLEYIEEIYEETDEQREANVKKILGEMLAEGDGEVSNERISMISKIMKMNMKDRMKMAMKGDREARNILIRDPNRVISQAVIQNPKITEQEVEKIASMKTVPDDVLRQVAINRKWARNYTIMHKLAQNPRTPIGNVISIMNRLQLRDLMAMSKNRNVPDAVRKHAMRLSKARASR